MGVVVVDDAVVEGVVAVFVSVSLSFGTAVAVVFAGSVFGVSVFVVVVLVVVVAVVGVVVSLVDSGLGSSTRCRFVVVVVVVDFNGGALVRLIPLVHSEHTRTLPNHTLWASAQDEH